MCLIPNLTDRLTDFISASINTKLLQKHGGLRKEPLKALPIEFKVEDGGRVAANPVRSLLNY